MQNSFFFLRVHIPKKSAFNQVFAVINKVVAQLIVFRNQVECPPCDT
jgi:hypothetical protein